MHIYSEERAFGPLTMKQLLVLAAFGVIAYGAYLLGDPISLVGAALLFGGAIGVAFHLRPRKIEGEDAIRMYAQSPAGMRRINKAQAALTELIRRRTQVGLPDVPELTQTLQELSTFSSTQTGDVSVLTRVLH